MVITKENAIRMVESTFKQMCKEGIMWGTEPLFNDVVDLKVNDNRMKLLILNYLQFTRKIGYDLVGDRNSYNKTLWGNIATSEDFVEKTKSFGCFGYQINPLSFKNMYDWIKEKPAIFDGPIYIKFYYKNMGSYNYKKDYYKDRIAFNEELNRIESSGIDINRFLPIIFYPKDRWKWSFGENLGEFISMLYFRSKGYITNPHMHVGAGRYGSKYPDMFAWRTPIQKKLIENGIIESGTTIFELSTLCLFGKVKHSGLEVPKLKNFDEAMVMEVEDTRPQDGLAQLFAAEKNKYDGYISGGNFDKAFLVAPFLDKDYFKDSYGILTFNDNGLVFNDCQKTYSVPELKDRTIQGMNNLIKMVLMTNLSIKDLIDISGEETYNISFYDLIIKISSNVQTEDILIQKLKERYISNIA